MLYFFIVFTDVTASVEVTDSVYCSSVGEFSGTQN